MNELRPESAANGERNTINIGSPKASILQTLISIARSIRALLSLRLAELGLGSGQDEILLSLQSGESASTAILATRLDLRETSLSKLLEPLIAKGLIERVGEMRDARRMVVRISHAGTAMQERVQGIWNEIGNDLVGPMGSEQLDRLITELEGMQKTMNSRLTRFS